jgi:Leucine-rich repeat (LRR) protein
MQTALQRIQLAKETNAISLDLSGLGLNDLPAELFELSSLTELYLGNNQLLAIPKEIGQLSSLTTLYLNFNQLVNIPKEIGQLSSLTELDLCNNKLIKIPKEIGQLSSVTRLCLSHNQLKDIPKEIGQLSSLTELNLSNNQLENIPKEIGQLSSLITLYLWNNQLTSLPIEIVQLRQAEIKYFGNPIEYIPPNLWRFLQRERNDYQKVYSDKQNVHNHSIQDGISNSINYIMNQKPIIKTEQLSDFIIQNKYLSESTKQLLFEYSDNPDIHSRFGISFSELLLNVLSLIEHHQEYHENKEVIFAIMNQDMADAQCKCFTGRVSRLVNCLNGFDPNIIIQISNSEQIGNIIGLIQRQLEITGTYSIQTHIDLVRKELLERGYDDTVISEWVDAINN